MLGCQRLLELSRSSLGSQVVEIFLEVATLSRLEGTLFFLNSVIFDQGSFASGERF